MDTFTAIVVVTVIIGVLTVAVLLGGEIRRHRREQSLRAKLLKQIAQLLHESTCAACGGPWSTWDGLLDPLQADQHVGLPLRPGKPRAVYALQRQCMRCGRSLSLIVWSDGDNWGFAEVPDEINSPERNPSPTQMFRPPAADR